MRINSLIRKTSTLVNKMLLLPRKEHSRAIRTNYALEDSAGDLSEEIAISFHGKAISKQVPHMPSRYLLSI